MGLKEENITAVFMDEEDKVSISGFDIVFVCGGNTYAYLHCIKRLRLDKSIRKHIEKGCLYIGVSAGSILAGPSIKPDNSRNKFGLKDFSGLHLTNIVIFPHYSKERKRSVKNLKTEFKKVIPLKDNQAVLIRNDKTEII